MNNKVAIILVNYNNWQDTIECLESIYLCNYNLFTVIIVDNNSNDDSIEKIQFWINGNLNVWNSESNYLKSFSFPPFRKPIDYTIIKDFELSSIDLPILNVKTIYIIRSSHNKGFANANNLGINFAKRYNFEYYWLLNNDTVIGKKSLNYLVEKSNENKLTNLRIGILGSVLLYYHNPYLIQSIGGRYNKFLALSSQNYSNKIFNSSIYKRKHDYIVGASLFVQREFIYEVGLMSEEYFLFFEELDWIKRGKKFGWATDHELRSIVYHKEGNSTRKKENVNFVDLVQIRSRILFTLKFYPSYIFFVYLMIMISLFRRILRKEFKKIIPIIKIMINPGKSIV